MYLPLGLAILIEIGLTDLPKSGGAMANPAPSGTTGLIVNNKYPRSFLQGADASERKHFRNPLFKTGPSSEMGAWGAIIVLKIWLLSTQMSSKSTRGA